LLCRLASWDFVNLRVPNWSDKPWRSNLSETLAFFAGSGCLAFWGLGFVLTRKFLRGRETTDKYGHAYDLAGDLFETIAPTLLALGLLGMAISALILIFDPSA
jgi:drug/metabolite transporter (DMT)-like permease